MKTSKKLPLWLVWSNPDAMADIGDQFYSIMFKNGDGKRVLLDHDSDYD